MSSRAKSPNANTPDGDTDSQDKSLTAQQLRFIEHLLSGKGVSNAALMTGISRKTAYNWLTGNTSVSREYELQRIASRDALRERVKRIHDKAFQALEDMLGEKAGDATRFQVVKLLYDSQLSHLFTHHESKPAEETLMGDAEYRQQQDYRKSMLAMHLYDDRGNLRIVD